MKFVILAVLFAGANCVYPPSGPAFTAQLINLGKAANEFQNVAGVLNTITGLLSSTKDASILKINAGELSTVIEALAANVSSVADAISSGNSLSGINNAVAGVVAAKTDEYNVLIGISDGSGSPGSYADLKEKADSLQELAGENSKLAGVINGLSGDTAVAFGVAAESYNLIDSLNALADARSSFAYVSSVIASDLAEASVILDFANQQNSVALSEQDLADAFTNAANK